MKLKIACLFTFALILSACGKETDADKIADAQNCLDSSPISEVDACLAKVEGLESEGAYLIRCAGSFIKEGYSTPSKLSTALENLSSTSGSSGNASLNTISLLAFSSKSTSALNATFASDTFSYCQKSKSNGLILLAGLSLTATTMWNLSTAFSGNTTPPTADQIRTELTNLLSNPTATETIGAATISMYQSNCQVSNSAPGSMCAQFQSVITASGGTSDPSSVGEQLLTCFNNPNAAGCSSF